MDVAPRYKLLTLLTLLTLFILLKLLYTATTLACMPIYIVREGKNAIGKGCNELLSKMLGEWSSEDGWIPLRLL